MLHELDALRKAALEGSLADFVAAHAKPGLVLRPFTEEVDTSLSTLPGRSGTAKQLSVTLIEKRVGANPFPMITLGRSANNDVVLAHSSVSKFHAYFRVVEERMSLVDAGSTLGTFVRGRRLQPTIDQVALVTRDELRFAELAGTFLMPAELYAWLRGDLAIPGV